MERNWEDFLKRNNIEIPQGLPIITICEGVDGSGKTTLMNILMDIIKYSLMIHTSAPPKNVSERYYSNLLKTLMLTIENVEQPLFLDRFHIGEMAYSETFRPHTLDMLKRQKMNLIDRQLEEKKDVKVIYCYAENDVIKDRLINRGDWLITVDDIEPIVTNYDKYLANSNLSIYRLDTTKGISENDIIKIIDFLYNAKQ